MDEIEFVIEKSIDQRENVLNIYINNEKIINIIKNYESKFTKYTKENPGKYDGILLRYFYDINIKNHFLNKNEEGNNIYFENIDKIQILGCTCLEPSCWPFLLKVHEYENKIEWKEYEQPFRNKGSRYNNRIGRYWDYSDLKIFKFEKELYSIKLDNILKEIEILKKGHSA
jgi:hypothetical protein